MKSLQNIPVNNSSIKAQVMFDSSSEISLVSSIFAKRNNLPYEEAMYTLAGVGSKATTYNFGENGRIYSVPLMDSNREVVIIKVFSVENILTEWIQRDEVKFHTKRISLAPLKKISGCR